jgi:cytochrome P450
MFGKGIFSTALDQHRKYRKIMVPAFSTANLRGMVPLFYDVAQRVPFTKRSQRKYLISARLEMVSLPPTLRLLHRR